MKTSTYSQKKSKVSSNRLTHSAIIEIIPTVNHRGIERSLDFMVNNFARPIQIKDIGKLSGLSRRGFQKSFTKRLGVNPGMMLRHVRIEYAKRILCEQDLTLKELAQRCGFRSDNTLCVAFQRTVGLAPKKFQRLQLLNERRERHGRNIPLVHRPPSL